MKTQLLKIANLLYINMQYATDNSLLKGKMGLILFFYEYGRYTGISSYTDAADNLLDEVIESLSLENGEVLIDIAWSIQYLIRNKLVEGNPDEVLSEIDEKVIQMLRNYKHTLVDECKNKIKKNDSYSLIGSYVLSSSNSKIINMKNINNILMFYEEMLRQKDVKLPLMFLNICYIFVSLASSCCEEMRNVSQFAKYLEHCYKKSIDNNLYNEGDMIFFNRIRNESQIDLSVKPLNLYDFKSIDSYIHYSISELLYLGKNYYLPDVLLIETYIGKLINNISNAKLSLNGLASIGIILVKRLTN